MTSLPSCRRTPSRSLSFVWRIYAPPGARGQGLSLTRAHFVTPAGRIHWPKEQLPEIESAASRSLRACLTCARPVELPPQAGDAAFSNWINLSTAPR